ncbi:MAG: 16S rRNA (cytidine(1402)-2'-O)-methyltransferase [Erysipelotrichaceae bacterium]|nr:16S rRNA (cytidine(1402)-2'-O)-methyltransferase [Erysipelotrichaceae bacterium]
MAGTLYLVATPIGNLSEFSPRAIETLQKVEVIGCEDTRTSRPLLDRFDIHTRTVSYHNFNEEESSKGLLKLLEEGKDVALISDAGYPLISDPGYRMVQEAIAAGITVVPVSGPNAAINALVGAGLDTAHFLFYGFLSSKDSEARRELKSLSAFPYTLIFYEAPHRILRTLRLAEEVLGERKAVVARELSKLHEEFCRGTLHSLQRPEGYRGEIVLLIEGKKEETAAMSLEEALQRMKEEVAGGLPARKAAQKAAEESGYHRNELYQAYIREKENG